MFKAVLVYLTCRYCVHFTSYTPISHYNIKTWSCVGSPIAAKTSLTCWGMHTRPLRLTCGTRDWNSGSNSFGSLWVGEVARCSFNESDLWMPDWNLWSIKDKVLFVVFLELFPSILCHGRISYSAFTVLGEVVLWLIGVKSLIKLFRSWY